MARVSNGRVEAGQDHAVMNPANANEPIPDDVGVKDLLLHYARNTTMHGVPSIVGSELYRGRHFFWLVLVFVMAAFLGTTVYWQMKDYYNYPTVTSTNIAYVTGEDFPAITVCDLNMFHGFFIRRFVNEYTAYHLTKLTEITGLYHKYSHKFFKRIPEPAPSNKTSSAKYLEVLVSGIRSILEDARYNVFYCSWGDHHWDRCDVAVTTSITEMGVCNTIDVRKLANSTMHSPQSHAGRPAVSNALRGLTFYLDTSSHPIPYRFYQFQGFKIVLHDPDQMPLPKTSGFVVAGNTTVEVEVAKTVKIGLPPPFMAFGTGTCVDAHKEDFRNPLKRYANYTKEACENECFIEFVVKTCGGCRHFLHPGTESLCPVDKLAKCYRQAEDEYYGSQRHTVRQNASSTEKRCECPIPCRDARYSASLSSAPFVTTEFLTQLQDNFSTGGRVDMTWTYIRFYYADPVVTTIEQVPVYTTEGLLGAIGGQIGLFMGFSLLTGAELVELLFLLVTHGRRRKQCGGAGGGGEEGRNKEEKEARNHEDNNE